MLERGLVVINDKTQSIEPLVRYHVQFLPFADRRDLVVWSDGEVLRWVGLLGVGLGLGLVLWSGIALGRFYSIEKNDDCEPAIPVLASA